jgi:hypothetical protein
MQSKTSNREFEKASKYALALYPNCALNERFMEVFIEFVTKKMQIHIEEIVGTKITPGNNKRTFPDENKRRNKMVNRIKLSNDEEIITENYSKINNKVIKAEMNAIVLRNMFEQFQILLRALFLDKETLLAENQDFEVSSEEELDRVRTELALNIRGALSILENENINSTVIDNVGSTMKDYTENLIMERFRILRSR